MITGCSLRLKTKTRSCESVATPATSPCVQPVGSCSQSATSSKVIVFSPTSMAVYSLASVHWFGLGDRACPCPVANVDDQALGRLEFGLVEDVAQTDGVQFDRA